MDLNLSNSTFELKEEAKNCLLFKWQVSQINPSAFSLVMAIFDCLMSVLTIIGNGLVIITVYRTASLHSPSNILIAGLALSDFGTGLITQPSHFIEFIAASGRGHSCMVNTAFLVLNISGWLFTMLSLYTLTCIAIERYFAIVFHLRYNEKVTVKRTVIVLLLAWVLIPLASTLISFKTLDAPPKLLFTNAIFIIVGLTITSLCHVKVFLVARRHFGQIHNQLRGKSLEHNLAISTARYRRNFYTVLLIVGACMACYLPYSVAVLAGFRQRRRIILLTLVAGSNSALNPLIYFWRIKELRDATKRFVNKLFTCCKDKSEITMN